MAISKEVRIVMSVSGVVAPEAESEEAATKMEWLMSMQREKREPWMKREKTSMAMILTVMMMKERVAIESARQSTETGEPPMV
jgi:hypothetical protein